METTGDCPSEGDGHPEMVCGWCMRWDPEQQRQNTASGRLHKPHTKIICCALRNIFHIVVVVVVVVKLAHVSHMYLIGCLHTCICLSGAPEPEGIGGRRMASREVWREGPGYSVVGLHVRPTSE